jgi:nucleoid-associated protein Lsr2
MAQKVQIVLVDDVDGGKAEETVAFSLDGTGYEIDLSGKNAAKLRDAFAPWVGAARRAGGRGRRRGGRGGAGRSSGDSAAIRDWARSQGLEVSDRGRISAELRASYEAAH